MVRRGDASAAAVRCFAARVPLQLHDGAAALVRRYGRSPASHQCCWCHLLPVPALRALPGSHGFQTFLDFPDLFLETLNPHNS